MRSPRDKFLHPANMQAVTSQGALTTEQREREPLASLREYQRLAPWNLRDLSAMAGAILDVSGIRPTSAAASIRPSERTIRFYVTRGLVSPPDGRGAAATYRYRHLLQVLAIKLRQMEGGTLSTITEELKTTPGDSTERRVAAALGSRLPHPSMLAIPDTDRARGRAGRALRTWHALTPDSPGAPSATDRGFALTKWHRFPVARGLELHVHEGHPLASYTDRANEIADSIRQALNRTVNDIEGS